MSLASRITALATRIGQEVKAKQATLVSGTNIKTVNGSSLLGAGDLVITSLSNIDGGAASATYTSDQQFDGGSA